VALLKAYGIDSEDSEIMLAIAILYMQNRQWQRALSFARRRLELTPNDPEARNLLNQVERAIGR
jgi:hypothetical protein